MVNIFSGFSRLVADICFNSILSLIALYESQGLIMQQSIGNNPAEFRISVRAPLAKSNSMHV